MPNVAFEFSNNKGIVCYISLVLNCKLPILMLLFAEFRIKDYVGIIINFNNYISIMPTRRQNEK